MEIHVIGFASHQAFTSYLEDPLRVALQPLQKSSGARTELHELRDVL
jgi:hypothetical protein